MDQIKLEEAIDTLIASHDLSNEEFVRRTREKILKLSEDDAAKLRHISGALHYHVDILK